MIEQNHEQVDSDSFIMENTMEITVFQLFDNLPLNIAKKVDEFVLPISKLKENTLLHMSTTCLEVFLKFQTS